MDEEMLPKFDYYLDKSDPDVVILRRQDGTFVAAFSAQGVTREGILEAPGRTTRPCFEKTWAIWPRSPRNSAGAPER